MMLCGEFYSSLLLIGEEEGEGEEIGNSTRVFNASKILNRNVETLSIVVKFEKMGL